MEKTVFLNGEAMHLIGNLPEAGTPAPYFALVNKDLSEINLHDFKGKRVVLNIFPSLDTDVCAASVRKFNKEVGEYDNTVVICVSKDLPFAMGRFCVANDIKNVYTASGFRSDFGKEYGIELVDGPLRGLYARALVIINEEGNVMGTSLCEEITEEPDYDFAKKLLEGKM
ncbi:MAG: thiol peroxidase [Muribaculaceae bacterium]|nr:thiol peroxidase [Muribaculaceae bacterium]